MDHIYLLGGWGGWGTRIFDIFEGLNFFFIKKSQAPIKDRKIYALHWVGGGGGGFMTH